MATTLMATAANRAPTATATRELDADDRAALRALQQQQRQHLDGGAARSLLPRPRGVALCPHCREGFGSASLAIHVRRCRALLPTTVGLDDGLGGGDGSVSEQLQTAASSSTATATAAKASKRRRPVSSLVDLCLRVIFRDFQGVCMNRISSRAEEEAALIDSIPTSLVHRIIVSLVADTKQLEERDAARRAETHALRTELQAAQHRCTRLEGSRQQAATARARLHEQEQTSERLRKSVDALTLELAAADAQSQQLRAQSEGVERQQHRQEAKINSLSAEVETLKASVRAAQRKEAEALKQLAAAGKQRVRSSNNSSSSIPGSAATSASASASMRSTLRAAASAPTKRRLERSHSTASSDTNSVSVRKLSNLGAGFKRPPSTSAVLKDAVRDDSKCSVTAETPRLQLHARPRNDVTGIPLPSTLSPMYLELLTATTAASDGAPSAA